MNDEGHEELAALYALDLLDGVEQTRFEAALAGNAQLEQQVRALREAACSLAYAATPAVPPAGLKSRLSASIDRISANASPNVLRPAPSLFRQILPWGMAASLAIVGLWLGQAYLALRLENQARRDQATLAELTLENARAQLESERLVAQRQLALIDENSRLAAEAKERLATLETARLAAEGRLTEARERISERERELVDAKARTADRERQISVLTERMERMAVAALDLDRQIGEARAESVRLARELKSQAELADLKITTLASLLKNSPEALAVAVWDPKKQEGVLKFAKLPALSADQDYQLWVVDPQYKDPVDGGVFTVDPATGDGRISFKARQPVRAINAFAVTRERKGGVPKAEGPFVLLGK